ncbi:MAG TPA: AI-2E family transporter [bacterium]|nr:AI-2E family transporter [bacterium]
MKLTAAVKPLRINITTATIVKTVAILLLLYLAFLVKEVLALVFVALIFASAFDPWVDFLQRRKWPRALSITMIYLIVIGLVAAMIYVMVPILVKEATDLANNFPYYFNKLSDFLDNLRRTFGHYGLADNFQNNLDNLATTLSGWTLQVVSAVYGAFNGLFSVFLIMVLTFYMVVEENAIKKIVWSLTPARHQAYAIDLVGRMQLQIGYWLRGQLILCLAIFLLTYLGLSILGVKYALLLALVAGLTEAIPYLGPILGGVPAVLLAMTQSPRLALVVIVMYLIIQQLENNILVPQIMKRAANVNPITSIIVLLVGYKIGGVAGAVIAIPVATAVSVGLKDLFNYKEKKELRLDKAA